MTQNYPAKRNTFVLVAVVLFNLIWLALLFLSCQADNEPKTTPTPIVHQTHLQRIPLCSYYSVPLYNPPSTCNITPVI